MILVTGSTGILGSAIMRRAVADEYFGRLEDEDFLNTSGYESAILCAGTKGTEACEGNRKVFRSDVDGNIRLARHLLKSGSFVVFVSTEAVEWALNTAYARNRFMVELAIGGLPNVAIVRPGRFDPSNVGPLADLCIKVATEKLEGLHYWKSV